MISTTHAYKEAILKNRWFEYEITISFTDDTVKKLSQKQLLSLSVEDSVSGTSSFDIGSAIVNQATIKIDNTDGTFDEFDFENAKIEITIGLKLKNGTIEKLRKGIYFAEPGQFTGAVVTVKAQDNMSKFDRPYSESNLTYPATLGAIVRDACSCCGVSLAADSAAFEKDDFVVQSRPDDGTLTFRQVLLWVGQISCHWCRCNERGQLSLGWYNTALLERLTQAEMDGGSFNPWTEGDTLSGGTFNPWTEGNETDGGTFAEMKDYHHIFSLASMSIATDDVVITGIQVVDEADEGQQTYLQGSKGYVLAIEGNKLVQGKGQEVAAYLGQKVIGLRFRPLSVSCLSDPSIEAGDVALVTDRKGRNYAALITNTTFQAGNYQSVTCDAETPRRNSTTRYSESTRIYQELRQRLDRNKTEWEKAVNNLGDRLDNSSGTYTTIVADGEGGEITYTHNKPLLEDSDIIWKETAEARAVSTDGGKTWNAGITVDGELITRILNAIGINADWINAGSIVIKDENGNITFFADTATGEVRATGKFFTKSSNQWGQEFVGIEDSIIKGGVLNQSDSAAYDSLIDLAAQYEDGVFLVLRNNNGKIILQADVARIEGRLTATKLIQARGSLRVYSGFSIRKSLADSSTVFFYNKSAQRMASNIDFVCNKKLITRGVVVYDGKGEGFSVNANGKALYLSGNPVTVYGDLGITGTVSIGNIASSSSGNHVMIDEFGDLKKGASSSLRYKSVAKKVTEEEVQALYNLPILWAKYKEGYLPKQDERCNTYYPMFLAEEMERHFPLAVDHDESGKPENWNERVLIPCMMKMLQNQKERIDQQEQEIIEIKNELEKTRHSQGKGE